MYRIEGQTDGRWSTLGNGASIGYKRIQPVVPVTVDALRIVTTKSVGTPVFRNIAIFHAGFAPPSDWNAAPQIWEANTVGRWRDNIFFIDLTSRIDAAKQYRFRSVPGTGTVTGLRKVVFKPHCVVEPNFVKPVIRKPNELILDITGVAETVQVFGKVEGASSGDILLQEL